MIVTVLPGVFRVDLPQDPQAPGVATGNPWGEGGGWWKTIGMGLKIEIAGLRDWFSFGGSATATLCAA